MSKREKQAYRREQADMLKLILGELVIMIMFALMFGQAFMF